MLPQKIFITTAEYNEPSSAAYRNRILYSVWKMLAKIQLGVICTHMVDYRRLSHIIIILMSMVQNNDIIYPAINHNTVHCTNW